MDFDLSVQYTKNSLRVDSEEMKTIQAYFKKTGREPTDVELETLAQTWSEHCKHKTFAGVIDYEEEGRGSRLYELSLPWLVNAST